MADPVGIAVTTIDGAKSKDKLQVRELTLSIDMELSHSAFFPFSLRLEKSLSQKKKKDGSV